MTASAMAAIHMGHLEAEAMTAVTAIEAVAAMTAMTAEAMVTASVDMTAMIIMTADHQIAVIQTMFVVIPAILKYVNLTLY